MDFSFLSPVSHIAILEGKKADQKEEVTRKLLKRNRKWPLGPGAPGDCMENRTHGKQRDGPCDGVNCAPLPPQISYVGVPTPRTSKCGCIWSRAPKEVIKVK